MEPCATTLDEAYARLCAPFPEAVHKYRVGATWPNGRGGKSGIPLTYINARDVMDLLDRVVGPGGWQDEITPTNVPGAFVCKLTILGVTKSAVGQAGENEGEKEKSGDSDALKRAAVKFGIGRYLYSRDLPPVDLVEGKDGKWTLPRNWRPVGGSPAASIGDDGPYPGSSGTTGAPAGRLERAPVQPPQGPRKYGQTENGIVLRPSSRHKLYDSKINAVMARAKDLCGWAPADLLAFVQREYGAPTIADLSLHEFTELMDAKLQTAADRRRPRETA
jgi:hypothetical protein